MLKRMIAVLLLKREAYREISEDTTATWQAGLIVLVASLVQGFLTGLVEVDKQTELVSADLGQAMEKALAVLVAGLIAWLVTALVLIVLARLLGGRANAGAMLRVTGYVEVFTLVLVLGLLALAVPALIFLMEIVILAAAILAAIGYIIGVSEASGISIRRSFVASIAAGIINLLVVIFLADMILRAFGVW